MAGLALMGVEPDKINASLRALDDAVYKNGMIVNGLGYITTDELHAYEEGSTSMPSGSTSTGANPSRSSG